MKNLTNKQVADFIKAYIPYDGAYVTGGASSGSISHHYFLGNVKVCRVIHSFKTGLNRVILY